MNYEQKYKEALERARDMMSYREVRREDMEYLFPELKGSEDELILRDATGAVSIAYCLARKTRREEILLE